MINIQVVNVIKLFCKWADGTKKSGLHAEYAELRAFARGLNYSNGAGLHGKCPSCRHGT